MNLCTRSFHKLIKFQIKCQEFKYPDIIEKNINYDDMRVLLLSLLVFALEVLTASFLNLFRFQWQIKQKTTNKSSCRGIVVIFSCSGCNNYFDTVSVRKRRRRFNDYDRMFIKPQWWNYRSVPFDRSSIYHRSLVSHWETHPFNYVIQLFNFTTGHTIAIWIWDGLRSSQSTPWIFRQFLQGD